MKLNLKAIEKELKKLNSKRKELNLEIECKQYELKSIESVMLPLKEAYDSLAKLTGERPFQQGVTITPKPEAIEERRLLKPGKLPKPTTQTWPQTCYGCDTEFQKTHPRQRYCPSCKTGGTD